MANVKVSALTADTSPTSDDLIPTVTDPAGTPASRKVTLANAITKAHGLSDGLVKVSSGTMATASSGTDYAPATSGTGILKGNGSGGFSTATANTDYFAPKANLAATAAPGAANDNTQGYAVGSVWVDTTNDKSYIAVDVTTGAAVWNDLTASAAGGINNVVEDLTPQLGGDLDLNAKNITTGAVTISPTEVSYLDGVTSAIQGQIDGKQPLDADLTTIAGLTATTDNFIQSKSSAWASRTPTQVTADLIAMVGDSGAGGTKGLVPAPAAGDAAASKFLKADGTWTAVSSGGQTLVTHIVAASGGTHTTLQDALTAASAGDTIYVREGTYALAANTSSVLTDITIIGENAMTSLISMTTYNLTLSGTGVRLINVGFSSSTGDLILSGANSKTDGIYLTKTGTDYGLSVTGAYSTVVNSYFTSTSTAQRMINVGAAHVKVANCTYNGTGSGNATIGIFHADANYISFIGNTLYTTSGTDTPIVSSSTNCASGLLIDGNNIYNSSTTAIGIYAHGSTNSPTITGNSIMYCKVGISLNSLYASVTGNTFIQSTTTNTYGINNVPNYSTVSNNTFNSSAASVAAINIANSKTGYVVTGNTITGSYTTGIAIGSDNTKAVVSNNVIQYNLTNPITYDVTGAFNNIANNSGGNPTTEMTYQYMKNTSGGIIAAGAVVVHKAVAAGNEITTTTTAGDDKVYGVTGESIANNAIGGVITTGKVTNLKVNGTTAIAVGDFLTTFTTAGIAAKAAAGDQVFAIALEAYSTADSNGVIDALLIVPRMI